MTRNERVGPGGGFADGNTVSRRTFGHFLHSDPIIRSPSRHDEDDEGGAPGTGAGYYEGASTSAETSPFSLSPSYQLSPWNNTPSPYARSPWVVKSPALEVVGEDHCLPVGSIVREEGHIYSLAASGDLLYTGSDSKNIRVWRGLREYSGFKSGSGLVKAIVVAGERIFTGHQDGKIRVWKASPSHPAVYRRIGNLPTTGDSLRSSMNPRNYVQVRRNRNVLRIRHYDAVSCLSLDRERGLLYSGSWDKTVKVWRASDFKFIESIAAHKDAVNSVVAGFDDLVFTGSADGTVKAWRRELQGKEARHFMVQLLLEQETAVTALAVSVEAAAVYCGSSAGLVNAWEREKQRLSHATVLRGHKLAVLCLAVAGSLVFSGSADKSICVWRRDGGGVHSCLSVLTGHSGPVKCLAVEEDFEWGGTAAVTGGRVRRWNVYSGSLDKSVKVWKVAETAAGPV